MERGPSAEEIRAKIKECFPGGELAGVGPFEEASNGHD
jgi:hypothetical protein